jgi:hypothetical protein
VLAARHRSRFRYELGGRDTIAGAKTIRLEFEETASPTIVQYPQGGDVISYGTANVEIETGRVWRMLLTWRDPNRPPAPPGAHQTAMRVDFAVDTRLGLMVPVKMQESFLAGNGNGRGTATYRNFRRYETKARIVP